MTAWSSRTDLVCLLSLARGAHGTHIALPPPGSLATKGKWWRSTAAEAAVEGVDKNERSVFNFF
jgi:hypothetical protein